MKIRMLRACSNPIRISSPELHIWHIGFLHELHIMERYVITRLRTCSVRIRISSPELHMSHTCFLHELHIMERYVITRYRLHGLQKYAQGGFVTNTFS